LILNVRKKISSEQRLPLSFVYSVNSGNGSMKLKIVDKPGRV